MQEDGEFDEELDDSGEEDIDEHTTETYEETMATFDDEHLNSTEENPLNQQTPKKKHKTIVTPQKKSKKVRSNKLALSEITSGFKTLADLSTRQQ